MCMGGCGGSAKSSGKSNSYTPKKMMGSKGMKTPSSPKGYRSGNAGNFGQPKVRMSFSGRGR